MSGVAALALGSSSRGDSLTLNNAYETYFIDGHKLYVIVNTHIDSANYMMMDYSSSLKELRSRDEFRVIDGPELGSKHGFIAITEAGLTLLNCPTQPTPVGGVFDCGNELGKPRLNVNFGRQGPYFFKGSDLMFPLAKGGEKSIPFRRIVDFLDIPDESQIKNISGFFVSNDSVLMLVETQSQFRFGIVDSQLKNKEKSRKKVIAYNIDNEQDPLVRVSDARLNENGNIEFIIERIYEAAPLPYPEAYSREIVEFHSESGLKTFDSRDRKYSEFFETLKDSEVSFSPTSPKDLLIGLKFDEDSENRRFCLQFFDTNITKLNMDKQMMELR